ncbi:MAG TPA: type II toxin-antitoxin system HicA family toxin [Pyrinomonadaceae bacterium]|mgnify:CR=1 FL=1|nr:type II toxin-antitoxin system HicA family toxin [Pyrinomonadaceae bacterium]
MKLKELIRHLEQRNCLFYREGGSHTVYKNVRSGKLTAIPRHREIKDKLVKKICEDLGIDTPNSNK